jgi:hypothetical protein
MQQKTFENILAQAKNQFMILVKGERFFVNLQKEFVMNELGIIAISENTGSASIVFIEDIESVIVDGKKVMV